MKKPGKAHGRCQLKTCGTPRNHNQQKKQAKNIAKNHQATHKKRLEKWQGGAIFMRNLKKPGRPSKILVFLMDRNECRVSIAFRPRRGYDRQGAMCKSTSSW